MFRRSTLIATVVGICAALPLAVTSARGDAAAGGPIYQDTTYSFGERAADLVARMTPQQRATQLTSSQAPAIPALGIPAYGWWNEALHGVSRESTAASGNAITLQNTTSYPIDQSLGASWDPDLVYRVAREVSDEAREVVRQNKLDLDFYSPTMNMQRDPRWGRNDEAYGEDPHLVTKIVSQFVNGLEGKDQAGNLLADGNGFYKAIATIKHYAANNSEVNRRNGSANMDDRTLREYFTKAFRGITQESHVGSVMSSYNAINGVPTASSVYLMDTLLRQTFGFTGYVTSDCDAIAGITSQHHWNPPGYTRQVTGPEVLAFALSAGEDLECNAGFTGTSTYRNNELTAIGMNILTQTGIHTVNDLDVSATRLFTTRMQLGEFDPDANVPWVNAARARVPQGTWVNNNTNNAVTETPARLALAREAGTKSLVLLKNAATTRKDGSTGKLLPITVPSEGAFKVLVIGALGNNANFYLGGYSSTQGTAGQAKEVSPYNGLKAAIQAVNPAAQVDFLRGFTGTSNTAANLTAVDPAAVTAAAGYDYVVVVTGTDAGTANEDRDRTTITLPGAQGSLISQVAAVNPNTVAYMETIGPIDVTSFEPGTSAILWSSYNGMRKGEALADVLFGAYNPSGRTNGIWYQNVGQIPTITDYTIRPVGATGRTYMYYSGPLQYPFGYGLSYSDFAYSNLAVDKHAADANDTLHVTVDVTNTSGVAGSEVVELYVSTPGSDPALQRPRKRLEGFRKVALDAGQTKTVSFDLKVPDLAFYDDTAGKWSVDTGAYGIQIARSSADGDIQQQDVVNVTGSIARVPSVVTAKPTMAGDAARGITQRVLFAEGVVVSPGLTVSMNDDTLYGFVESGSSKPFPAGMTFAYSSNRPEVVTVDGSGVIRTVGNGAATVTATATYGGVSRSTTFVVRVLSYLDGITFNGRPVGGFLPDRFAYDVVVPDGVSTVPQIAATAPGGTVAVTQATAVPGTATITATGADGIVATYAVSFARSSRSDEFGDSALGPQWTVVRPSATAPVSLTATPGSLAIKPEQGDLNGATNTAKNLVLQDAPGDWTMESKLNFNVTPHVANQQGGIIAYGSDNDYLKLDWEFGTQAQLALVLEDNLSGAPVVQTLTTLPTAAILGTGNDKNVWLRMTKSGTTYTAFYSTDGTTFTQLWKTGATLSNVKVGPFAYNRNGTAADLTVLFDWFHVTSTGVAAQPAPVTTAVPEPTAVNGWYAQSPTLTLNAVDRSGWGIDRTEYRVDGGAWQTYAAPFSISGEGIHTLELHSADKGGNVEDVQSLVVKVDTLAPAISIATPVAGATYILGKTVAADYACTDGPVDTTSGVAACVGSVPDGSGIDTSTVGTHVFAVQAGDGAGNLSSAEASYVVASLLGTDALGSQANGNQGGKAEAFRTSAPYGGTIRELSVFLTAQSESERAIVGLYSADGTHPGTLLAKGVVASPQNGAWNTASLDRAVTVAAGGTYWIAVLSPEGSGAVEYLDECCGGKGNGPSETSRSVHLTELPATWRTGTVFKNDAPLSAYGVINP